MLSNVRIHGSSMKSVWSFLPTQLVADTAIKSESLYVLSFVSCTRSVYIGK